MRTQSFIWSSIFFSGFIGSKGGGGWISLSYELTKIAKVSLYQRLCSTRKVYIINYQVGFELPVWTSEVQFPVVSWLLYVSRHPDHHFFPVLVSSNCPEDWWVILKTECEIRMATIKAQRTKILKPSLLNWRPNGNWSSLGAETTSI